MSTLPWIPRFDFGASTLTLTYPVTRWNAGARTEGRFLKSSTGVPGPSLSLRKYLLDVTLRYTEDEWPDVMAFVSYAQMGDSFVWYPQSHDDAQASFVTSWLESPRMNAGIRPVRDASLLWLFTLQITLSRMSSPWDLEYFRIPLEA